MVEEGTWEARRPAWSTYDLLNRAMLAAPDRIALTELPTGNPDDGDLRTTRREMMRSITQAANLFSSLGVGPEDSVGMLLPSGAVAFQTIFGAQAVGIAAPINPMLQTREIAHLLKLAGSRVLVASTDPATGIWPKAQELAQCLPDLTVLTTGPRQPGFADITTAAGNEPADSLSSGRRPAPGDVSAYIHTGGTTGLPKLARITHDNFLYGAWAQSRLWGFDDKDVVLSALPLFHVSGLATLGMVPLGVGAEVVTLSPTGFRNPEIVRNFWRIVERYRGSFSAFVPTIAQVLSTVPVDGADISSLRTIMVGGAAAPVETLRRLERHIDARIVVTYGQTECLVGTGSRPNEEPDPLSSGRPAPHMRLAIRRTADSAEDLPRGEVGQILMKGPAVFAGYKGGTAGDGFTPDGWLITGDIGWQDGAGSLFVAGRSKDLIIRSGHNIDPRVIEEAGASHPAVAACAAVGAPDRYAGELPVLYVALRPGVDVGQDELANWLAERVPERPAVPKQIYILPSLPVTAVGKLYKPLLRLDAAVRVARRELAPLLESRKVIAVTASHDEKLGTVIEVTVDRPFAPGGPIAGEIADRLGGFLFHHRIGPVGPTAAI